MEKLFGLWVDHEKAIIVSLMNGNHKVIYVKSDIEGHFRLKDDSQSINPSNLQGNTIESKMDSRYRKYLDIYFQHIIDVLKEAKHIFIFGPGEAKIELKKSIEKNNIFLNKISGIEASDKLTESQIIAKVKKYFKKE
ncbi:MAG: hypothetical protein U9N08_07775 [Candidatus Caldatribacteriota bacterium]|nr:hypothetical protein [Candidatus Caldatribacteriota bacterium]